MLAAFFQYLLILQLYGPTEIQQLNPVESADGNDYLEITWSDLSRVQLKTKYNAELKMDAPYPIFHKSVEALDGKNVIISGYAIPLEETAEKIVVILSAFPFSSCFFCGAAGPESVMDIKFKKARKRLEMDRKVTIRGRLQLNSEDLYSLFYILNDAELVK